MGGERSDLAVPESVKDLQFTIIARSTEKRNGFSDVKGAGNIDIGFKITPESLAQHIAALAPDIAKHSRSAIFIYPADFGPGLQIVAGVVPLPSHKPVSAPPPESSQWTEESDANWRAYASQAIRELDANAAADAIATVRLWDENSRSQAIWLIQNGKATLQQTEAKDDDSTDSFAAALKSLLESMSPRFQFYIQLLTRADADKFKAAAEELSGQSEPSPPPTEDEE